MVAEQLRQIDVMPGSIILEPIGRNTAPAVALAALAAKSPDEVLLVLAADHVINDVQAFHQAIESACQLAESDALVTFGIVPSGPETGYGYIRRGTGIDTLAFHVDAFVEKPDLETAQSYLEDGGYYWNSGMFAFKASVYLAELERHNPDMLAVCRQALASAELSYDFVKLDRAVFEKCPSDSIDYAVMEKTHNAAVIPLDAGWNDVGSWSALWDVSDKNGHGNSLQGDVITYDTNNSYVHSEYKLVAAIGLENMVVVETDDAVMVAPKDRVQDVKKIVEQLKAMGRSEAEYHRKIYRPWGYYDCIDCGNRHKAKRIVVKPGAKLSVQLHHHRAEHWIIVKGTARVTKGEESYLVSENESTYIPIGVKHSLENPGVIPLEMIEVQTGSYLGEDDIVRFSDKYGRS
jgi:mannose-1-phosphate guanylyltransferase/mannose-1-phosphate guanylyltransferase/mannose-6-phosphate isomerase